MVAGDGAAVFTELHCDDREDAMAALATLGTLAEQCGAEVLWIDANGNEFTTAGFAGILRN